MAPRLVEQRRCDLGLHKESAEAPAASSQLLRPPRRRQPSRLASVAAIAVGVMASLAVEVDARPTSRRKNRVRTGPGRDYDGMGVVSTTLLMFLCLAMVCGGGIGWCLYLEYNPSVGRVRLVMYGMLAVATSFELSLCAVGVLRWWVAIVITGATVWGSLDAVLRYPVVHEIDTIFTLKQIILLGIKSLAYVLGCHDFGHTKLCLFALLLMNIVSLPLLYFLALPLDDTEQEKAAAAEDVVDVDLLWRLGKLLLDPEERHRCMLGCRRRARLMTVQLALMSPTAANVICSSDPSYKQILSTRRRRV